MESNDIITQFQEGNETAFQQLIEQYQQKAFRMIDLNYIDQNQNRNDISLTIQPQWKQQKDVSTPNNTKMIDDIQINIYETDNKFVPVNYELTETDQELQKKGLLNIAYGSDTVEENHSTLLTWNKDSLSYFLLYMGQQEVDQKELLNMASEIISNK